MTTEQRARAHSLAASAGRHMRKMLEEVQLDKTIATARDAMDQELAATPMKRADHPPINWSHLRSVYLSLCAAKIAPATVSITVPEKDFLSLSRDYACNFDGASALRMFGMEILRGVDEVIIWWSGDLKVIEPNREALEAEILRCLGRGGVGELPQSASSNGVSPSVKTVGEIGVTPSPAGRDNRDSDRTADLSHEAKIIAAKAAIAVYGREKKLPSAEMLAAFGELDRAKASRGVAAVGVDLRPGAVNYVPRPGGVEWINLAPPNINRHAHRLSSESLSRAADQIWSANSGGTYADLVCSRAERLAEVGYRSEAAADG